MDGHGETGCQAGAPRQARSILQSGLRQPTWNIHYPADRDVVRVAVAFGTGAPLRYYLGTAAYQSHNACTLGKEALSP